MNTLIERITMKHLMVFSIGMLLAGLLWLGIVWLTGLDIIWYVPGAFLILSGGIKMVTVRVWAHIAKLGTDEHRPIKAL